MVVFGQSGCIWTKVVVFRQSDCIWTKWLYIWTKRLHLDKGGCIWIKWLQVFGQTGLHLDKVVAFNWTKGFSV